MTKNKKLLVIGVIFIVMFLCMKCARADSFYEVDSSLSSTIDSATPTPTPTPTPTFTPTPSPEPDYSSITMRLDSLYELNSSAKNQILISIWALTGLFLGYVIIKDSFK